MSCFFSSVNPYKPYKTSGVQFEARFKGAFLVGITLLIPVNTK
jgi:hypothetical protein